MCVFGIQKLFKNNDASKRMCSRYIKFLSFQEHNPNNNITIIKMENRRLLRKKLSADSQNRRK